MVQYCKHKLHQFHHISHFNEFTIKTQSNNEERTQHINHNKMLTVWNEFSNKFECASQKNNGKGMIAMAGGLEWTEHQGMFEGKLDAQYATVPHNTSTVYSTVLETKNRDGEQYAFYAGVVLWNTVQYILLRNHSKQAAIRDTKTVRYASYDNSTHYIASTVRTVACIVLLGQGYTGAVPPSTIPDTRPGTVYPLLLAYFISRQYFNSQYAP